MPYEVEPAELLKADEGRDGDERVDSLPEASVGMERLLFDDVVLPDIVDLCEARLMVPWLLAAFAATAPGL